MYIRKLGELNRTQFSVIIPLYNKAFYIERAIQSVLAQTIVDYEVIVVDDCSDDNGAELASHCLEQSGVSYKIITRSTRGGSCAPARATGIRHACGKFLAFLDADDEWRDRFLEEVLSMIERFPQAEAYAVNRELVVDGKIQACGYSENIGNEVPHVLSLSDYLHARQHYSNPFRVQGMVFIPEALDDIGGFRHAPRSSDIDLMFRFFLSGKLAAWSPYKGLIIHRVADSTVSTTPFQITRPWFYPIQEAIDRGLVSVDQRKQLYREIWNKRIKDVAAATARKRLDKRFLQTIRFCDAPTLYVLIAILMNVPIAQRSITANFIRRWIR